MGVIDFLTKQVHLLNIVDLLHICEGPIRLFPKDLEEKSRAKYIKKPKIVGQPFPAFMPSIMRKLKKLTRHEMNKFMPVI